jgi:type IV secretion system protein VirB9
MRRLSSTGPQGAVLIATLSACHLSAFADPRLRDVTYDSQAVVNVPVQRGVVTLIVLGDDESIQEVATGLGADCSKPETAWCVAAQPGGRTLFVKPKSGANTPNTLSVVTTARTHAFRLQLLAHQGGGTPIYRLVVKPPQKPVPLPTPAAVPTTPTLEVLAAVPAPPPQLVVRERLQAKPSVVNSSYSIAEGEHSADIVPSLVFDDGRFTYFRFSGNREVPAVFQVLEDGRETVVNARIEDELLVADRVTRRLMLRSGAAVVGVWNDAFDLEGVPPIDGTTVPGVRRRLKTDTVSSTPNTSHEAQP